MKEFIKDSKKFFAMPELVVVGCSAGGIEALKNMFFALPRDFVPAMVVVQHVSTDAPQALADFFQFVATVKVKEAEDKESIQPNTVYFAPSGYHLMISTSKTFQLSVEEAINFSRPSIDVLFETAADAYRDKLIGIILTGANEDGANGLFRIQTFGGKTIVQKPETAEFPTMPERAIRKVKKPDAVLTLPEIYQTLKQFGSSQ